MDIFWLLFMKEEVEDRLEFGRIMYLVFKPGWRNADHTRSAHRGVRLLHVSERSFKLLLELEFFVLVVRLAFLPSLEMILW